MPHGQTKLPQMPADTGFGLGLFCGMLLGAVGVYMVTTPEGKALKKHLIEDFKKNQQTFILESVMPEANQPAPLKTSLAATVHRLIAEAKKYVSQTAPLPVKEKKAVSPKKKHVFKRK